MIKINSLEYKYEDGTKALREINFDLDKGKTIGVIGANGSGKSTLFLNILGILRPSSGQIDFNDKALEYDKKSLREYRKQVTMVFQDPEKQLFYSKVYDDVAFALRNLNYPEDEIKIRVDKALGAVNSIDLLEKPTHFLSYGQKKRVAIAGSLVLDSKVLLLDEPTSGLDPHMTGDMIKLIKDLKKDKKLIVSSHDMDFIYEVCDYIYVLSEGKIIGQGQASEIFLQTELIKTALLDKPWLVKVHEGLNLPLYKSEEEFKKKSIERG
nr:ATP-binding cassette domain-containing protein [Tissierella sp.]